MNPDELKVMSDTDCIISMAGMQPIYAEKILYYKDPALKGRANLPLPHVPELKVHLAAKPPAAALKPEYVPPEVLEDFNWRDAANAEELARSVLEAILPAGSPPEFVAQMVPAIARNWGEGSLSVIASILKETSGITVTRKRCTKKLLNDGFQTGCFLVTGQVLMNRRQSDGGIFCLEMKTAN